MKDAAVIDDFKAIKSGSTERKKNEHGWTDKDKAEQ